MDDGLLYGTPEAIKWSVELIESLVPISGLRMKYVKMNAYTPDQSSAQICRKLLPSYLEVRKD